MNSLIQWMELVWILVCTNQVLRRCILANGGNLAWDGIRNFSFSMYGHDIQLGKKTCSSFFEIHTTELRTKITWYEWLLQFRNIPFYIWVRCLKKLQCLLRLRKSPHHFLCHKSVCFFSYFFLLSFFVFSPGHCFFRITTAFTLVSEHPGLEMKIQYYCTLYSTEQ